jgi:hypothetical protein
MFRNITTTLSIEAADVDAGRAPLLPIVGESRIDLRPLAVGERSPSEVAPADRRTCWRRLPHGSRATRPSAGARLAALPQAGCVDGASLSWVPMPPSGPRRCPRCCRLCHWPASMPLLAARWLRLMRVAEVGNSSHLSLPDWPRSHSGCCCPDPAQSPPAVSPFWLDGAPAPACTGAGHGVGCTACLLHGPAHERRTTACCATNSSCGTPPRLCSMAPIRRCDLVVRDSPAPLLRSLPHTLNPKSQIPNTKNSIS